MRLLSLMTTAKASVFAATFAENWAFIWMSVTEFLALFWDVKDKHWEQFLVICWGYIWGRNQLLKIVKLCSESRSIAVDPWKFLLCKVCIIIINLRVSPTIQHNKHVGEITVVKNWWVVLLVSWFIRLKHHDYPAGLLQADFTDNRQVKFLVCGTGIESHWIIR